MTLQDGKPDQVLDIEPGQPLSPGDMVEIADMVLERHAEEQANGRAVKAQIKRDRWWNRLRRSVLPVGLLSERDREIVLQTPGRRPRTRQITYKGTMPPNASTFAGRFGTMMRNDTLDWQTLNIMRRNPMVKLGLTMRAAPVFSSLREARVECDDPDIAAFIKQEFVEPWLLKVANSSLIPAYIYGSAPHEKIWESRPVTVTRVDSGSEQVVTAFDGMALVYRDISFVRPETLESYNVTRQGRFDGFTQQSGTGSIRGNTVPAWKAFAYSNRFIFGQFWGESELEDVYPSWYYASFFRALMSDYMRLRAIPPIIATAPWGTSEGPDGEEVDNLAFAAEAIFQALTSQVVALPWESDPVSGVNKWTYNELELGGRVEDAFTRAIEEHETNILRGLLVPERTVTQNIAAVGSYNQAEIHQERMLDAAKLEVDAFLERVNDFLVPQMVEDNFGAGAPPCRIVAPNIPERLREKLHNILLTLLQNDTDENRINRSVDVQELLGILDIPFSMDGLTNMPVIDDEDEVDDEDES